MNERIRLPNLIVIDEEGVNLGKLTRDEALNVARNKELDLVLVSPNSENPVARIVDWSKFKYEKSKKLRKNKSKTVETKEWRFTGATQDFEMNIKLEKIRKHIEKGGVAKIVMRHERKTTKEQMQDNFEKLRNKYLEFSSEVGEVSNQGRDLSVVLKNK